MRSFTSRCSTSTSAPFAIWQYGLLKGGLLMRRMPSKPFQLLTIHQIRECTTGSTGKPPGTNGVYAVSTPVPKENLLAATMPNPGLGPKNSVMLEADIVGRLRVALLHQAVDDNWHTLVVNALPKEELKELQHISLSMVFTVFCITDSDIISDIIPLNNGWVSYAVKNGMNNAPLVYIFMADGRYRAVVKGTEAGKEKLKSAKSNWRIVEKSQPIVDDFFFITFNIQGLRDERDEVQRFYQDIQGGWVGIGQEFYHIYVNEMANPNSLKNLPLHFALDYKTLQGTLRPTPNTLWQLPCDPIAIHDPMLEAKYVMMLPNAPVETSKESILFHPPWVYSGASGSGKTASALTRSDFDNPEHSYVIGLYVKWHQGMSTKPTEFLNHVADELIARCQKAKSKDLRQTLFYILMDEMGPAKSAAHFVIKNRTSEFTEGLRQRLIKEGYNYDQMCEFRYAIVGTGVTGPGDDGDSMPKGYVLMEPKSDRLFLERLKEVLPYPDYPERLASDIQAAVNTHPHLQALLTNRRCAYLMADACRNIKLYFDTRNVSSVLDPVTVVARVEAVVAEYSSYLETYCTNEYIRHNGWNDQDSGQKFIYASWILSLAFTQPHGYHLLPPDVVERIVVKLGAVNDTLRLDTSKRSTAKAGPSHQHGYAPTDTQLSTSKSISGLAPITEKIHNVSMRFIVPPASIVVAVNILAGTASSGGKVSPDAYERIVVCMVEATLNAFLWYCQYRSIFMPIMSDTISYSVPLDHLFPQAPDKFRGKSLKLKVKKPEWENEKMLRDFEEHWWETRWKTVKADDLNLIVGEPSEPRVAEVVRKVENQIDERGGALVVAGAGTPLSDLTIITKELCIGLEMKCYQEGRCIQTDILRKRCFQIGYEELHLITKPELALVTGKRPKTALPTSLNDMFEKASWIEQEGVSNIQNKVVAFSSAPINTDPLTLVMPGMSAHMSKFGRIFHTVLRRGQEDYLVLCSPKSSLLPREILSAKFCWSNSATKVKSRQQYLELASWSEQNPKPQAQCLIFGVEISTVSMFWRCHRSVLAIPRSALTTPTPKRFCVFLNNPSLKSLDHTVVAREAAYYVVDGNNVLPRYDARVGLYEYLGFTCDEHARVITTRGSMKLAVGDKILKVSNRSVNSKATLEKNLKQFMIKSPHVRFVSLQVLRDGMKIAVELRYWEPKSSSLHPAK